MGLKAFNIKFDNADGTYYVGQTVTGRVEIQLDSPKKVRGILLKFKGEARVDWTVSESRTNHEGKSETETVSLTADEEYFRTQYYCLGSAKGDETELPIGLHVYPFTCVLPPQIPSSFEGDHGYIRYTVKAIIDRPWKFDHETKRAFTVVSVFDLNSNPRLAEEEKAEFEKFMCCFCCKSGPLSCALTVPKTGFVPGESIRLLAEIDNNSRATVDEVRFELKKVVTFRSKFPRSEMKKSEETVEKVSMGPIVNHTSKVYTPSIKVPPLPPSNLVHCGIIDLDYKLEIVLEVEGCHGNLEYSVPVSIGSIPLRLDPSAPPLTPPSDGPAIMGWTVDRQAPFFEQYNYGASTLKDKDDNQYTQYDANPYHPMYPVYNFSYPMNN